MTSDNTAPVRASFVKELVRGGWLRTPAWQEAFRGVPRHMFLSRFLRLTADGQRYEAIDNEHPEWLTLVYANGVLATQLDSDDACWQKARDQGPLRGTPTSSSTQPSLMAAMLEALEVHDGQRVLEVGTGTGYNAALLCHRLGDEQVTSIEYDRRVSDDAHHALNSAGYNPTLIVGDGGRGYETDAPYDQLIATYSVLTIPAAWLDQVRPGGVIITSLYRDLDVGLMARLIVNGDGTAHGRLLPDSAYFMPTRTHTQAESNALIQAASKQPSQTIRTSDLPSLISDEATGWAALAGLILLDVVRLDIFRDDGPIQWLVHPDGSWAYYQAGNRQVEQGGPHRLWDKLEAIYDRWQEIGQPTCDRTGLTVAAGRTQRVWVDTPEISVSADEIYPLTSK